MSQEEQASASFNDNSQENSSYNSESQSSPEWETNCLQITTNGVQETYELDYMKRVLECFDKYGFKRLAHAQRFKRISQHPRYISRFRKYVEDCGTRDSKFKIVSSKVYERFQNALLKRSETHDYDFRRWAMIEAKAIGLQEFKVSTRWLHSFKTSYNIVSRKITKFVTEVEIENPEALRLAATNFAQQVKDKSKNYEKSQVQNSDQSGFNYLLKHSRMHEHKGVKTVTAHSQSLNKQTHSYTK